MPSVHHLNTMVYAQVLHYVFLVALEATAVMANTGTGTGTSDQSRKKRKWNKNKKICCYNKRLNNKGLSNTGSILLMYNVLYNVLESIEAPVRQSK